MSSRTGATPAGLSVEEVWRRARRLAGAIGASGASILIMCNDDQWGDVRPLYGRRWLQPVRAEFDRLSDLHGSEAAIRLMFGVPAEGLAALPVG